VPTRTANANGGSGRSDQESREEGRRDRSATCSRSRPTSASVSWRRRSQPSPLRSRGGEVEGTLMVTDPRSVIRPDPGFQQLSADGVEFVLIGGIAGRVHGSPTVTNHFDICDHRTKAKCEWLANTLRECARGLAIFRPACCRRSMRDRSGRDTTSRFCDRSGSEVSRFSRTRRDDRL
jgi:hypothetical protein